MKILIAEDEPISRRILDATLVEWGYEVVSAGNGAEAWDALQAEDAPRLAILDWMMPEMDGIDVLRMVRSVPSSDPPYIILLTSMEGSQNIVNALETGANDYVNKPFNRDELWARIRVGERMVELQNKLLRYNENLEREVEERTADLLKAKDEAEAGTRIKTEFIANMSHEVRTPLNAIIGFSEMLRDGISGELNEQQKEYVNDIAESGKRLLELIFNVLDYAETEAGRSKLKTGNISVSDLLNACISMVKEKAGRQGVSLELEIVSGADTEIEADEKKLTQAICNLLDNAVKFTPDGGSVFVRARLWSSTKGQVSSVEKPHPEPTLTKGGIEGGVVSELATCNLQLDGDFFEISVTDTGIGIKPDDMPRLFMPFQQLEVVYTKKYKGTGLGLVLSRKLIELHGGKLWVESEYGKGTMVIFVIPVRQK